MKGVGRGEGKRRLHDSYIPHSSDKPPYVQNPPSPFTCFGLVINQLDNSVLANPRGSVNVPFFEFPESPRNSRN